jgi:large subunit ribosomal protein L4
MEVSVLNINGQETGRKVTLNESIFGIEPNDHVLYLDVKQYLANQRQGTAKSKERSEHKRVLLANWVAKRRRRCSSW